MASTWDIISSVLFLGIFLGVVFLAMKFSHLLNTSTTSAQSSLQSQGITYQQGKMSIKTDRAAPTRDEYILNTQAAFERGGKMMKAHKDAFSFKKGGGGGNEDDHASASGVDSSDRKGFRRTKKLA
ncbi:hypothetical protein I203_104789 [Kwoniella mangroviensis CBS 8507]|uniref:uncharacterized protein n=1 Tax=Kwoniella mangroviensis CBS 8507 TaxID=1296122 RepID=UPI00080D02D4|nr:uncharacterized protein I203_00268 [Kwoniella mangroviensis CBS 8507]OCF70136.1 hypothetical protein I203_00268 [Kwoniella mangroviensis CBS 8507]